MSTRLLSYTEVSTALTCFARHDFAYGGYLAGSSLKPRQTAAILSDGRAWGAGVAAWHATGDTRPALAAAWESLQEDALDAVRRGRPIDPATVIDQYDRIADLLEHYAATAERLPNLSRLEGELRCPVPSRGGRRGSNRYHFHCYIDGFSEQEGLPWIVENKLRMSLMDPALAATLPQYRWYAWAWAQVTGTRGAVGVLIDERLNAVPKPVRIVAGTAKEKPEPDGHGSPTDVLGWIDHVEECGTRRPSDAINQVTTPELYLAACRKYRHAPNPETVASLGERKWQQRIPLIFTPDEIDEAGRELTTAAQVIRDLDTGRLYPVRNGSRSNCQSCRFSAICSEPTNDFLVNSLYERTEPKRLRGPKPEGVR